MSDDEHLGLAVVHQGVNERAQLEGGSSGCRHRTVDGDRAGA